MDKQSKTIFKKEKKGEVYDIVGRTKGLGQEL